MSYLDASVPADSEAVTLGASRIRALESALNALIEQIFEDAGTFLPGWIQSGGAAGGASLFTPGAIQTADLADALVTTSKLAAGAVTNSILASESVDPSKLSSGFVAPTESVATASCQPGFLSADTAGRALMANGFILSAMMGFSFPEVVVGNYSGSNTESAEVNTLAFEPKILVIVNSIDHGIGIAFLSEAVGGFSSIHASWVNTPISGSPNAGAVQWIAPTDDESNGGFIIVPTNFAFNQSGAVHTYFAMSF